MSVANIVVQGQRAHLLTDSGYFWDDGRLAALGCKVLELPDLRAAISVRGALIPLALGRELEHSRPRSIDELIARLPEVVMSAEAINCPSADRRHEVHMIYYAPALGRCAAAYMATDKRELPAGHEPYQMIPVSEMFGPGRVAAAVLGRPVNTSDPASFNAERDGLAIVADQRREPWGMFGHPKAIRVGGDVRLTTVSREGVATRVIGGWEDAVGERIAA